MECKAYRNKRHTKISPTNWSNIISKLLVLFSIFCSCIRWMSVMRMAFLPCSKEESEINCKFGALVSVLELFFYLMGLNGRPTLTVKLINLVETYTWKQVDYDSKLHALTIMPWVHMLSCSCLNKPRQEDATEIRAVSFAVLHQLEQWYRRISHSASGVHDLVSWAAAFAAFPLKWCCRQ